MMRFAHSVEVAQQSAEIELLIAAGVFGLGSAFLFLRMGRTWGAFTTLGLALVAIIGAFVVPRMSGSPQPVPSSDPFLSITRPESGARVPAAQPIEVAVMLENAPLSTGGRLELLVDGQQRETSTSPEFQVQLPRGEHRLTVRYVPPVSSDEQAIESSIIVTGE
jgi:hypothetical protein